MKIYGYARISTPKQSIERQIRNIKNAYPDAVVVQEAYTGTKLDRPVWTSLMKKLRPNDIIVFDAVSRMSRNAEEGYSIYQELFNKDVDLVFLREPHINTSTYRKAITTGVPMTGTNVDIILNAVNGYLMTLAQEQIRLAFEQAEKEVLDLRQRTREGLLTAKMSGKRVGTPVGTHLITKKSLAAKEVILRHSKSFNGTLSDMDVIKLAGISRNSYYKYKREIMEEE